MAKTRTDLINRALSVLGVLAAGQAPAAEDRELVDAAIFGKLDDLADRGVVYLDDPDQIPEGWFEYLAMLVAQSVACDFGQIPDVNLITYAEGNLRRITADDYVSHPQQVDFY